MAVQHGGLLGRGATPYVPMEGSLEADRNTTSLSSGDFKRMYTNCEYSISASSLILHTCLWVKPGWFRSAVVGGCQTLQTNVKKHYNLVKLMWAIRPPHSTPKHKHYQPHTAQPEHAYSDSATSSLFHVSPCNPIVLAPLWSGSLGKQRQDLHQRRQAALITLLCQSFSTAEHSSHPAWRNYISS